MRTFLFPAIVAVMLALAPPVLAESTEDPCKNHYILSEIQGAPCVPCPPGDFVEAPLVVLAQGSKALVVGSELRYVAGGPSPRWLRSLAIARVDPAGDTDPTWGDCGIARIPIWGADDEARAIALQPDGKIVVLGTTLDPAEYGIRSNVLEPHSYLAVLRLNSDGSLDRTFATGGRLVFRIGEPIHVPGLYSAESDVNSRASGLAVRADGRIRVRPIPGRGNVALLRSDGTMEQVQPVFGAGDVAFELHASIEFINDRGEYFMTSDPDEAVMLDRSGTWYRTGRATRELTRVP